MKIDKFQEFRINEEEGWKDLAIGAAAFLGSIAPGLANTPNVSNFDTFNNNRMEIVDKGDDDTKVKNKRGVEYTINKNTSSKTTMSRLVATGWTLDSTSVDTIRGLIIQTRPDTLFHSHQLTFDADNNFESGHYDLSSAMSQEIMDEFQRILAEGGVIAQVIVESSTDKQQLSQELQSDLSSKGYTPDNKGLSRARNANVSKFIENLGVDSSIICPVYKHEQGSQEIDRNYRYVRVSILFFDKEVVQKETVEVVPKLREIYHLSKVVKTKVRRTNRFFQFIEKTTEVGNVKAFEPNVPCSWGGS